VSEINLAFDGMDIVLDQKAWQPLRTMTPSALARWLTKAAQHADWKKYLKAGLTLKGVLFGLRYCCKRNVIYLE
jgi:hypothetical protein